MKLELKKKARLPASSRSKVNLTNKLSKPQSRTGLKFKPKVKSTVGVTLKKVKSYIDNAHIKITEGEAYNVYHCGHVFTTPDDYPHTITYYKDKDRGIRSCPICKNEQLVTKYKLCGCGAEHIGKRTQPSNCCASCPTIRRNVGYSRIQNMKKRNSAMSDPERWNCKRKPICREMYSELDYDAVPCKNCGGYEIQPEYLGS